ncbi:MAG: sulfate adenylyltransferase [Thaumarchaeota archaeon]|nr:sulfate adenylyltransferase [Nitrososphaerota archaeon]MBE44821.1 sulfate adenylyltransferase [Nitrososphaerota archaeon]|tara:strand:- start:556 stop:1728 length:1173 start_codon:yes stop_codon:yes gene_type:complete
MKLGEPYGGKIISRMVDENKRADLTSQADGLPKIKPFIDAIYDLEKIGIGAYSPLEGYMDKETYLSVINNEKLPNGLPWTMPICLAPPTPENGKVLETLKNGDDVAILDWTDKPFAILHLEDKFNYDKKEYAQKVYATTDENHPNVGDIYNSLGDVMLGGKVDIIRRLDLPAGKYELTPIEMREHITKMGWKNTVGYQCRNPPHTAHEYIQRLSMERDEMEGIIIHPVVGRLKIGDYKPAIIMEAYQELVNAYYPPDRCLLASLSITMRYGGPKAALFLAIVRKNYGCTHYIVGRDQAGLKEYYTPYECHDIFDRHDVGIAPLKYKAAHFCRRCGGMSSPKVCPHPKEDHISTSQTKIRGLLKEGKEIPGEIVRPEVAKILSKQDIFVTE